MQAFPDLFASHPYSFANQMNLSHETILLHLLIMGKLLYIVFDETAERRNL
jgi:hypothetical protein